MVLAVEQGHPLKTKPYFLLRNDEPLACHNSAFPLHFTLLSQYINWPHLINFYPMLWNYTLYFAKSLKKGKMCCCDAHYFFILPFSFEVDESFQWLWNKLSLHWRVLQRIELSCINHHNKLSYYLGKCTSNFQFNIEPNMFKLVLTWITYDHWAHRMKFRRISCWINDRHLERGEKLGWVDWGREFGEDICMCKFTC